jgi:hypothetical protein
MKELVMMYKLAVDLVNQWKQRLHGISDALDVLLSRLNTQTPTSDPGKTEAHNIASAIGVWQAFIEKRAKNLDGVTTAILNAPTPIDAINQAEDALADPSMDDANKGWRAFIWQACIYPMLAALYGWRNTDEQSDEAARISQLLDDAAVFSSLSIDQLRELIAAEPGPATIAEAVRNAGDKVTSAISNAPSYPVLTQEVGYGASMSPHSMFPGGAGSISGSTSLGAVAAKAISDVLGWKAKADDPKAFLGALTASFTCTEVEGRTDCKWRPRTYAVATDLAGGITGAQASIFARAQEAVNNATPLLDGLYALDPTADREDISALKGVARNQMGEMVAELGVLGGPRSTRVSQYFSLLLDSPFPLLPGMTIQTDPNLIGGTLGTLRNILGCAVDDDFVNSVEDEQNVTNFRILSDYMTSLAQSWVNNLAFFMTPPPDGTQPFFGTQLVLLSRQLSVIAESVNEVRFAMDSVFIGPAERQTLGVLLGLQGSQPFAMYVEDLLSWVQTFAAEEGPSLVQDGGKYAVGDSFARQARNLSRLVSAAAQPLNVDAVPDAYFTGRVQVAWQELATQLSNLVAIAAPVRHRIQKTAAREVSTVVDLIDSAPDFGGLQHEIRQQRMNLGLAAVTGGSQRTTVIANPRSSPVIGNFPANFPKRK